MTLSSSSSMSSSVSHSSSYPNESLSVTPSSNGVSVLEKVSLTGASAAASHIFSSVVSSSSSSSSVFSQSSSIQNHHFSSSEGSSPSISSPSLKKERMAKPLLLYTDEQVKSLLKAGLECTRNFLLIDHYAGYFAYESADESFKSQCKAGSKKCNEYAYSFALHPGTNKSMQDRVFVNAIEVEVGGKKHQVSLFGVLDGHGVSGGGEKIADFVKDNIGVYLEECLESHNELNDTTITNALVKTFLDVNAAFYSIHGEEAGGTTLSMAMILNNRLWTANVGDSRIVFIQNGKVILITRDAKPGDPYFKPLIEARGGIVLNYDNGYYLMNPNNNGSKTGKVAWLGMVSSFGDFNLGQTSKGMFPHTVEPIISSMEVPSDGYFILGTDGLWDMVSPYTLAQIDQPSSVDLAHSAYKTRESVLLKYLPSPAIGNPFVGLDIDNIGVLIIDFAKSLSPDPSKRLKQLEKKAISKIFAENRIKAASS